MSGQLAILDANAHTTRTHRSRTISIALTMVLLGACSGSGGDGANDAAAPVPGAADLRVVLNTAGITDDSADVAVPDALFELGRALFFDKLLSGNHDVSCATCHWPELASADARTLPRGVGAVGLGTGRSGGAIIPRNSPMVLNAHRFATVFWDGRVEHGPGNSLITPAGTALTADMRAAFDPEFELLAAQAMLPPTSREEMRGQAGQNEVADVADSDFAGIWDALRDRVVAYSEYQQLILAAYPAVPLGDIEFAHLANAIAAFEVRAFDHDDTPFARFVRGDDRALNEREVAGALEFYGPANCASCHSGSMLTDHRFHNIGLPQLGPGKGDGAGGVDDFGRERVTGDPGDRYRFRTPSLINVELTAPYGHAGQYATLASIVDHYRDPRDRLARYDVFDHVTDPDLTSTVVDNRADVTARIANRLRPARQFGVDAIVAFLGALTDDAARDMQTLIPTSVPSGLSVR